MPTGTRDWARKTFSPARRRTIRALAEALFTDDLAGPDAGADARFSWLVDDVDDMVSSASLQHRRLMRLTLVLLELLPPIVVGRFARCSSLPFEARVRYLAALERARFTPLALLVVLWKSMLTILYFEHPEAAPRLGYDGRHTRALRVLDRTSASANEGATA